MVREPNFVAIACIWYERYMECSRLYGTRLFTNSVWSFYHSLLDLDADKRAIKTKVTKYINDEWIPMVNDLTIRIRKKDKVHDVSLENRRYYETMAKNRLAVYIYEHIIQTIQDSGIGWPTEKEMATYTYPTTPLDL